MMLGRCIDGIERHLFAPSLNDVGSQDTTDFLPADAPSQRADRLLAAAFPDDPTREASVIVVARAEGLTSADRAYLGELTAWLPRGMAPERSGQCNQRAPSRISPAYRRRGRAHRD